MYFTYILLRMSEQQNKDKELAKRFEEEKIAPYEESNLSTVKGEVTKNREILRDFLNGKVSEEQIRKELGETGVSMVQTELPTRTGKGSTLSLEKIEESFRRGPLEGSGS